MDFEEIYKIKLRYSKKKRRIKLCYRRDFVMVILIDRIENKFWGFWDLDEEVIGVFFYCSVWWSLGEYSL